MSDHSTSEKLVSKPGPGKDFSLSFAGFESNQPFAEHSAKAIHGRGDATDAVPRKAPKNEDVRVNGVWEGLPYKGKPYSFKNDDPEHMQPRMVRKAHIRIFMLDKDEDLKDYEAIMQNVCDDTAQISVEERKYDKKAKTWRILLRWVDLYYTEPAFLKEKGHVAPKARAG